MPLNLLTQTLYLVPLQPFSDLAIQITITSVYRMESHDTSNVSILQIRFFLNESGQCIYQYNSSHK